MTEYVIKIVEFADGSYCPIESQYLIGFDFEHDNGRGLGKFGDKVSAKRFPDAKAALDFWRTQSKTFPLRWDGQPNRPLTCTTVEIENAVT